ncbi:MULTISPECIES: riboflavin biosynthesis protein RibF [Sphingobium]|jgi:riboflavin kinase / FMN adenylyltransferase|uniref:riboflavin biosynthesis protein RibF n=1 Tax=Sphingobium TaxID=165695 RepID=UPI000C5C004E|nr:MULTISPECIES: riboflavin biosynthesis protein RibF [Sphingobium]MBA37260.1 riboflavin biosynthesis protein RibF [Sphingobium sp.]MBS50932.1 riboflavin biosynthesis protein RibF [Sphingobium sp.]MCC4258675.1 riboflavin biosynthesis protein RibF [Sphingobium lactosutens]MEC9016858.1 riboflavin biosynthesis protein RibF [Pseudomonadota bacterium]
MERLSSSAPVPPHLRGSVMALGNFDGFHAGHQAVVGRAIARAKAEGRPAIVATFDPHPMRLFRPDTPSFRLTTLDQREALFARAGADAMMIFDFTPALAALEPADYVRVLIEDMGVAAVVTGEDFTFGRARSGTIDSFAALGLPAQAVGPVSDGQGIISSTRVREALRAGDCETACRLLTRPFAIRGVVQHGDKLGRTIGFPTANIDMGPYLRPAYGIYAVRGILPDGRVLNGAANLGIRPSFDPPKELLEPHFFDFAESLYAQEVEVQLIRYLHGERKYDGLDALTAGIARDCADARQILAGTPMLA